MKEFWFWVAIVTLLIFLLFVSLLGILYINKQIKKAEIILLRAEQVEKKNAKPRVDPNPDDSGL
jgi:hypothetical protein